MNDEFHDAATCAVCAAYRAEIRKPRRGPTLRPRPEPEAVNDAPKEKP